MYVDHKEYDEYVENNRESSNIISCEEGIQGNLCRIRNHIMSKEFNEGADVVLIIDDDMKGIYYWEKNQKNLVKEKDVLNFIWKHSILAMDMGVYFWGININQDKQIYREYTPFSFLSYIGGPFQCFIKGGGIQYDEGLPLKEDYDMTLQQLNRHRRVLRLNKFFYIVKQSEQSGGCATYRNSKREMEQLEALQKKWRDKIVKKDINKRSHNLKVDTRAHEDYNPIIKVPIKGV